MKHGIAFALLAFLSTSFAQQRLAPAQQEPAPPQATVPEPQRQTVLVGDAVFVIADDANRIDKTRSPRLGYVTLSTGLTLGPRTRVVDTEGSFHLRFAVQRLPGVFEDVVFDGYFSTPEFPGPEKMTVYTIIDHDRDQELGKLYTDRHFTPTAGVFIPEPSERSPDALDSSSFVAISFSPKRAIGDRRYGSYEVAGQSVEVYEQTETVNRTLEVRLPDNINLGSDMDQGIAAWVHGDDSAFFGGRFQNIWVRQLTGKEDISYFESRDPSTDAQNLGVIFENSQVVVFQHCPAVGLECARHYGSATMLGTTFGNIPGR